MPRISRKNLNTSFLHVMVQGVNKDYIFNKDYYKKQYLELIKKFKNEFNIELLAYCIMSNHAHFAIFNEDKETLGKFMHKANFEYARLYNKAENRCGVLFRNRYNIEPIYNQKHLANCINYIHLNPVKAGMVEKCEDYKFSSYMDYMKNNGLATSDILHQIFGKNFDYTSMSKKQCGRLFMDVDPYSTSEVKECIQAGICEFEKINNLRIADCFEDKNYLKLLVKYLKEECAIPYFSIQEYFEMTNSTFNRIKKIDI